jgi:Domain of unknown function (DUF4062)
MTQQICRTRLRPVIRVFVSSTFSDMRHERNALQAKVFPKLEQICLNSGFQFQAIDLRWGVSTEASLDHLTMRICFDELRRAQETSPKPNFLILLGDRYGWRPLPEEISAEEFESLARAAEVATTRDKPPAVAVLRDWYRKDENAKPPVYVLQSRRQRMSDSKDYTQDAWDEVQSVLWAIINCAMPREQLQGRFDDGPLQGIRPQASSTFKPPPPSRKSGTVRCAFRTPRTMSSRSSGISRTSAVSPIRSRSRTLLTWRRPGALMQPSARNRNG